jgi:23S rRNA (adenine2503-C2)-methyltransferase
LDATCLAATLRGVLADIKSLTRDELAAGFRELDLPSWRLDQLLQWLYVRRVTSWDQMSNLPKALREQLGRRHSLRALALARRQGARDTTQKFLWRLHDGALIESVLIPANPSLYGERSDRHTLCVSTQVGCAYGCKFCASGLEGWKRNLQPEEIVEQVLATERWHREQPGAPVDAERRSIPLTPSLSPAPSGGEGARRADEEAAGIRTDAPRTVSQPPRLIDNLVIMGMGEPLANYDHLLKALTILNAPWGGGIGARKITISTSGLAPQIRRLAEEPLPFRLAISLHGATDATRNRIMPVNRKFPLRELVAACEHYQERKGRMITLEYILIAGVNNALAEVRPLAELARRLHAKVNLIPYNRVEGLPWERPDESAQEAFLAALRRRNTTATLRREKGHDIDAACGQLRLQTERAAGSRTAPAVSVPR